MQTKESVVVIKKGRAQPMWQGHPWVYAGAIAKVDGTPQPGAIVSVVDHEGRRIGRGCFNPSSQITVRMFTHKDESTIDADTENSSFLKALIVERIRQAAMLRKRLLLPSADTTAYRLVNSEGDRLSGLTIDMYADTAVVQFTSLGLKQHENSVYDALRKLDAPYRPQHIIEVAVPKFAKIEGFVSTNRVVSSTGNFSETTPILCKEGGLSFQVAPLSGQKTGMFLDQRENRIRLGQLCKDASVLDVYSYMGAFSLHALRHGARSAVCVDSSAQALHRVVLGANSNGLTTPTVVEMDAFRYLETVTPYSFDVVILDPPKFAASQKDVDAALKGYRRLNALGMNAVKRGGLLATCSCSQLISVQEFERMLAAAAIDAGRQVSIIDSRSQGPDHPALPAFQEGKYLKFNLLSVT